MKINYTDDGKIKSIELYIDDLTEEARNSVIEMLGDNGNYDTNQIVTIYNYDYFDFDYDGYDEIK